MSGGSSRREGNEVRVVGVDLARKSPMRSRYPDSTSKSPMRERNFGDSDGGTDPSRGNGRRTPVRSRYADESRSPMRARNAQSKSSGRSADADARKSPLRRPANHEEIQARDKAGAWVEHVKGEARYGNKLVTPTESFRAWLPGEERTDQHQAELNRPSASPRKQKTWIAEDPRERPEPIAEADEEHGNVYGRSRAELSYDDWVGEDDYGRARRYTDLRYQDAGVFERPRGRREQWEAERIGFQGIPPGVSYRASVDSYETPSSYHSGSNHRYGEHPRYRAPTNLQNVAIKQEEIIRKYNELGEYIERIGDIPYTQGGRGDFYGDADDYLHDEFIRVRRGTVQSSGLHDSPRMRNGYIPHPAPGPSCIQVSHYHHQQVAPRRPGDLVYDPRTENVHHPTYDMPDAKQPPASFYEYQAHPNRQTHGKHTQESKFPNPTPNNVSSNSRTSSEGSSVAYERPKKVLVSQNQQHCHPIAGAAPFVICSQCSSLLRLPGKLRAMKKKQCRLQCRSCRTITSFSFDKKRSHSSLLTNLKPNGTSELVSKSGNKNFSHNSVAGLENRESFDFKDAGYLFPSSESEPSTELEDQRRNSSESKMRPGLSPSSSNEAVVQTVASSSKEEKFLPKFPLLRPPPGSPLRYHIEYSDILAANGSLGKETDASGQDAAVSNELSLNSKESPKNVASQGSTYVSVRNDHVFQFQDLSLLPSSNGSNAEAGVFVNGQPIDRDAVRSAEKLAGTISPGNYWYDKMSGFWGLMGSHCLGIIPPFILEFKAPMPENCSGGDTGVFVNGRELHQNDLDELSTRGLPRTRYKCYVVDISGRVEDEDTGHFVRNLGKLAPNVVLSGRGFGMQPPERNNA